MAGLAPLLSWPEFVLVFQNDPAAGMVPVIDETLPPAIAGPAPFQQKSVCPLPGHQDLAGLGVRRNVIREAMKTLAQSGRHGHRQRDTFRIVSLKSLPFG